MRVGVIRTEKEIFGERVVNALRKYGGYEVDSVIIPKGLPLLIDDPETYLEDRLIRSSDLIVSCIFYKETNYPYLIRAHPDLTLYVADLCERYGVDLVAPRTERLAWRRGYGIRIASVEIGCELKKYRGGYLGRFAKNFGVPEFKVEVRDNRIERIEVKRGAPCGTTWEIARKMVGENVSEAPKKAAILHQHYCSAPRAYDIFTRKERGLHKAGELHLRAMENAIQSFHL